MRLSLEDGIKKRKKKGRKFECRSFLRPDERKGERGGEGKDGVKQKLRPSPDVGEKGERVGT